MSCSECRPNQSIDKSVNVWQRTFEKKKIKNSKSPLSNCKQNNALYFYSKRVRDVVMSDFTYSGVLKSK